MRSLVFYRSLTLISRTVIVLLLSCHANAANELAQSFTLDGQLLLAGTTTVLSDSAAVLKIDILDPTKSCILYEEQQTVNTVSSDGYFSVQVGSVTGASKRTSSDPGLTMVQVFQNTSAVAATSASGSTCSGNTYTPSADAVRYFRITVTPSSTNVADVLSPDTTIDAAPMAMVAQTLQGYQATDFLAKAGLPTCSSGTFLTYDGTSMTCAAVSGSSGGTVTSITAGTGLTGGTITASGTLALATSGATAGTYGSASAVPVVTVDTYGRVTNVTTASISSSPSGAASGDLSGTYPGPTVNGLSGTALSISSLTSGQYLKYNGTNWINSTLSVSDSNITYASEAANTFFAAPNGSAGTPTFRAMVAADLPTVPYTRGGTGLTATPANGQIAIGNGAGYALSTLTAGTGVSITNAAGSVTIAATGGTGTVTSVTGTSPISVATGTSTPVVSISQATSSSDGYLSSTDWNTFNSKMGSSLASGDIFVGNSSGGAVPVAVSGDATLSNTGVLTLASVATAGTYEKVIVNAKGLVTSGSSLGSSDITTALGYTPVNKAGDSMSGNLTFAPTKGTVYTDSGSNTVTVEAPTTITTSYVLKLPTAVASAAGQVLTSDTSGNLSWSTPSTTATSYSGILPIANGGTNSSTALTGNQVMISSGGKIVEGGAMANGQLMIGSGSGAPIPATLTAGSGITITNAANSITIASSGSSMPALPSADIFVGNSSGGAAAVAMSGDIGITNAGATTVNKIQGTAVSATTPTTSGQILRYTSGTGWVPDFVSMADLRSTITGATALTSCGANQTLTWTAAADNLTCTSIAISDSQITYGSETANTVLAAPNGSAGVPTYRALVAADLPTVPYTRGGTGLTATPANGQVAIGNGSGYTLGTLTAGTGVSITNSAGSVTIAATGGTGTVTSVTGTAPISVATGTTTPAISISQATTSTDGYLSSTDWNTFNSKMSSSLASGDIFVGNASGAATAVAMSGDATLSSAGALTLATVATAGTYEKVIVNAKGLVTSGSSLGSSDITTALGYTPVNKAGDSMSGNLTHAASTGDIYTAGSGSNTVTVEGPSGAIGTSYVLRLPTSVASVAGQVLTSDTSGNLSWTTPSTTATSYSGILPIANGGTNSSTTLNNNRIMVSSGGSIVEASALTNGQLLIGSTGAAPAAATLTAGTGITITNAANSITIAASGTSMPALPSADIFVGNSSGGAAAVAMSGDVTITNAGATTVGKLQGTTLSGTTPTTAGQVLRYNGSAWTPNFVSMADLRSTITGATALTSCGASQTLTWTAVADNLICTNIAISDSQITYGSKAANTFLAAPNGSSGAPTYRAIASADLPSGTLSGSGTANYIPYYSTASTMANSPLYVSSGNVGIGVTGPTMPFAVGTTGTTASTEYIVGEMGYTSNGSTLSSGVASGYFVGSGGTVQEGRLRSIGNIPLALGTSSTPRAIYILNSGNVGVGTTSPTGLFSIGGGVSDTPASNAGSHFTEANLIQNDSGTAASGTVTGATFNYYGIPTLTATNSNVTTTNAQNLYVNGAPLAGTNETITNSTSLYLNGNSVNSVGSVTNSYGLFVNANSGATNNYAAVFYGGNVGVGTTAPASALHVGSAPAVTANYPLLALGSGPFNGSSTGYFTGNSNGTVIGANTASGYTGDMINLQIAGSSKFKVDYQGNITSSGTTSSSGNTTSTGNYSTSGNISTTGTGTITSAGGITSTGAITDSSTTASTSSTTGALTVSGGVGIAGALYTGSTINSTGNITSGADFLAAYGTAAAPSYAYTSDTTTGVFAPSAGLLAFSTGGVERMRLNSTGVGIGTTSPAGLLDINKTLSQAVSNATGAYMSLSASTLTDSSTASSGTATGAVFNSIASSTLAASNTSVTTTRANTLYIAGAPKAGTNEALTGTSALYVDAAAVAPTGTATNSYGMIVNSQTGATNNYIASFISSSSPYVGIGTTAPAYDLHLYNGHGGGTVGIDGTGTQSISLLKGGTIYGAWTSPNANPGNITFTATGSMALQSSSSSVLTLNASGGNVGIGTTSPSSPLHVLSSASGGILVDSSNTNSTSVNLSNSATSGRSWALFSSGGGPTPAGNFGIYDNTGTAVRLTINSSGYVGIGTTSPVGTLDVGAGAGNHLVTVNAGADNLSANTGTELIKYYGASQTSSVIKFSEGNPTSPYGTITFGTANGGSLVPQMAILSTGVVGIGTTTPSYTLHVVGTAGLSSGTAWTNASDIRLKDIQGDYKNGLDEVLKLHTVKYNYKKGNALGLPSDFTKTGFIAQEVQKVIPEAVSTRKDGYLELNVDPIHWAVVNAIKDLYNKYIVPLMDNDKKQDRAIASVQSEAAHQDQEIKELRQENADIKAREKEKDRQIQSLEQRLERIEKSLNSQSAK